MVWVVNDPLPSFSYHATVSSVYEAESTSMWPSPLMSAAATEYAPSASSVMVWVVNDKAAACLRARAAIRMVALIIASIVV